ncbi:RNA polymerase sigma factor [Chitinophaga sp. MM2321]|uniref:RNA polymerase sigma factor n=1 Tax=Chitinophaga sp. MM2321 TaxID=3137178 RepID=UPI0032D5A492
MLIPPQLLTFQVPAATPVIYQQPAFFLPISGRLHIVANSEHLKLTIMSSTEFNNLLLGNADFLRPYAVTLTKDAESAKDLYQETLFRALSNRDKYLAGTNIRAWLYTIMRNIFINNYRRGNRQYKLLDNAVGDYLLSHQPSAIGNFAESDLRVKDVQMAVYSLPVIFKQPFLLYFEGYKYYEIATILHEPLGTVKSRIHFARKMLKTRITRH